MKYLRTFESSEEINSEYKVGDYIKIDIKNKDVLNFLEGNAPDNLSDIAKIVEVEAPNKVLLAKRNYYFYKIEFHNRYSFNVKPEEVLRAATPQEITLFNAKRRSPRFNL